MSVQNKAKVTPVVTIQSVPRTVVALGFVSLFMDLSSEIIHSLLPVFLVTPNATTPTLEASGNKGFVRAAIP